MKDKHILERLPLGESKAMTTKELARAFNMNVRAFRAELAELRKSGEVICGSRHGVYLPESREESQRWISTTRARAIAMLKGCESAERKLEEIPGQTRLVLDELEGGRG